MSNQKEEESEAEWQEYIVARSRVNSTAVVSRPQSDDSKEAQQFGEV